MPRENLLRVHATGLAFPAGARTNDKVVRTADDRLNQSRNETGNVAAVAIEKHDQIAFLGNRRCARRTGATVSAWRPNDSCSRVSGAFRRLVCTAIVNDDGFARNFRRDYFTHHLRDRLFFIQSWNDNGNPHLGKSDNRLFEKNLL